MALYERVSCVGHASVAGIKYVVILQTNNNFSLLCGLNQTVSIHWQKRVGLQLVMDQPDPWIYFLLLLGWTYLMFPMRAILAVSNWPNPSMILSHVSYEGNIGCIKLTKSLNEFISCFLCGQYWLYQIDQIPQWFYLMFPMRAILAYQINQIPQWFYLMFPMRAILAVSNWPNPSMILPPVSYEGNIDCMYQIDQMPQWFYLLFPMRAILTVSNWPNPSMILPPVSYEGNIDCIKLTKSLYDFTSCFLWGQYWLYQIDQIPQWFYLLFPMRAILAVSNWPNASMILSHVSYEGNIGCIKLTKSLNDFISCFLWGQYRLYQIDQIPLWFYLLFPMRAILTVSNWPNPSMILPSVSYEGNIDCIKLTKSLNDFTSCFLWGQYWLYQIDQIPLGQKKKMLCLWLPDRPILYRPTVMFLLPFALVLGLSFGKNLYRRPDIRTNTSRV